MAPKYPPPIFKAAVSPPDDPAHGAALVFVHGFSDSASGLEPVADQFQNGGKLPYMSWTLPDAPMNHDAMAQSWYMPTALSPFPSQRPELDDPEDEEGMKETMAHIVGLIDDLVDKGIPANRIVLGGFSQGCAMTFLTGLTSKYAGKLAGLAGVAGYMPLSDHIKRLRDEAGLPAEIGDVPIFYSRGTKDMLVPKRFFTHCVEKFKELGIKDELVETHQQEGLGHVIAGPVLRDLCNWLEKRLPPVA